MKTAAQIKSHLFDNGCYPDQVCLKNGVFKARFSFFYTMGKYHQDKAEEVKKALGDKGDVIESGQFFKPFRGGSSLAQSSHWWVTFTLRGGTK